MSRESLMRLLEQQQGGGYVPQGSDTGGAFGAQPAYASGATPKQVAEEDDERSLLRKAFDFFTNNTQKFGQTLGDAIAAPMVANQLADSASQQAELDQKLIEAIRTADPATRERLIANLKSRQAGEQTGRTVAVLENGKRIMGTMNENGEFIPDEMPEQGSYEFNELSNNRARFEQATGLEDIVPSSTKTDKQVFGEGAGTALEALSFGQFSGGAAAASNTGKLVTGSANVFNKASKFGLPAVGLNQMNKALPLAAQSGRAAFVEGAKRLAPQGAAFGTAGGAAAAMRQDKTLSEIARDAFIGGTVGAVISGVLGGLQGRSQFNRDTKLAERKARAATTYQKAFRASSKKAKEDMDRVVDDLLDDGLWGRQKTLLKKISEKTELSQSEVKKLANIDGVMSNVDDVLSKIDDDLAQMRTPLGGFSPSMETKAKKLLSLRAEIVAYAGFDEALRNSAQSRMAGLQTKIYESTQIDGNAQYDEIIKTLGRDRLFKEGRTMTRELADDRFRDIVGKLTMENPSIDWRSKILQKVDLDNVTPEELGAVAMSAVREVMETPDGARAFGVEGTTQEIWRKLLIDIRRSYDKKAYKTALETMDDASTKAAFKEVADSIREVINSNDPDLAKWNNMHSTYKTALDLLNAKMQKEGNQRLFTLTDKLSLIGGAGAGLVGGAGGVGVGALGALALSQIARSSWFLTLSGVAQNNLANALYNMSGNQLPQVLQTIANKGFVEAARVISENTSGGATSLIAPPAGAAGTRPMDETDQQLDRIFSPTFSNQFNQVSQPQDDVDAQLDQIFSGLQF